MSFRFNVTVKMKNLVFVVKKILISLDGMYKGKMIDNVCIGLYLWWDLKNTPDQVNGTLKKLYIM